MHTFNIFSLVASFSLYKPDTRTQIRSQEKLPWDGALRSNFNYRSVKNAEVVNKSFLSEIYEISAQ